MDLTKILRTLITCLFVITFVLLVASAYQRNRAIAELAVLSDSTSSILTRLAVEELAHADGSGVHPYVVNPLKLQALEDFELEIGGENFGFQVSVSYSELGELTLGPYGPMPPEGRTTCAISAAVALLDNGHLVPAKLKVVAWHA